ncbi:MAG: sugar ABC transporter ATP-binding protein [Lachnospiraceae bacterium]|nr:sugar ABC transporter ATP-binding protein [Lachnospiraceae bacterium]
MADYKLELKGVCKSFPGVKALDGVQLAVRPGTVHALMGENGAGKSTLMKCLFGIYKMDEGEIYIDGEKTDILNPDDAMKKGIAMVHQELQPVLARSVGENLYLGRFPTHNYGPLKVIDHKKMYAETERWLKELEMDFDPKAPLGSLSIGQMQSVEIAKAVSHDAKVIIFDEPTSSLSDKEVEALFRIMNMLRDRGVAMIYISHKMDEIKRIADDITVMRDGTYVGTWPAAEMSTDQIIAKMVGRELTNVYPERESNIGEVVLEVNDLSSIHEKSFQDISFTLRKGEILGFGGLVGAQRTELMEGIFGIRHIAKGEIKVHGKPVNIKKSKDAMNAKIGMITEDRRGNGIFGCLSIKDNVGVSVYNKYLNAGFILDHGKINKIVDDSIERLSIKTPSMQEHIQNLSGGNQQKVIISRWLANDPDILIMDEPTRGIDVGAKHEIYEIMADLAKQGKAIIMISSEMPELLGMSDRVYVMCNGHITGEITVKEDMNQEKVMSYATMFSQTAVKE